MASAKRYTRQMSTESVPEVGLWRCLTCNLMNFAIVSKCQACFTAKFDLRTGCAHLCDNDLADIIMECNEQELIQIFNQLEYKNAIYRNHSFLSLLIDIGKINLIFLLFQNGYKFALNYSSSSKSSSKYVSDNKILPLSMAFERDEIYLIKLLLAKGANPNQCTHQSNLGLRYEWHDLTNYNVYLHHLPISIPIKKNKERERRREYDSANQNLDLIENEEIFQLLIYFGALWYEDEYMFLFSNKDASFWINFLSSYNYRIERYFIHNAMKKYYKNFIKPQIMKTVLYEIEPIISEYFVSFPRIDIMISNQINIENINNESDDEKENSDDDDLITVSELESSSNNKQQHMHSVEVQNIYGKILNCNRLNETANDPKQTTLCEQYEYIICDENNKKINILINDERIWKYLNIGDIIHIKNGTLMYNYNDYGNVSNMKLVFSTTLTSPISIVKEDKVLQKFTKD